MQEIIGFTGKAGVGKDTCADYLASGAVGGAWVVMGFADAVKEAALAIDPWVLIDPLAVLHEPGRSAYTPVRLSAIVANIGWDDAKKMPEVRRLLQKIGTEAGRELHGPDCWVDILKRRLRALPKGTNVAIKDIRFDNEANLVAMEEGVVIEVRGASRRPATGGAAKHVSEAGVSPCFVGYVIYNTGTVEDLHKYVRTCVESGRTSNTVILGEAP